MPTKVSYIHVHATKENYVTSETWDEVEFNEGDFDWNDVMAEYLARGYTNIKLEVRGEIN